MTFTWNYGFWTKCGSLWYYMLILNWMKTLMVVSLWVYGIKYLNEWVVYVIACVWNSNPRRQFVKWIMPRIFPSLWGDVRGGTPSRVWCISTEFDCGQKSTVYWIWICFWYCESVIDWGRFTWKYYFMTWYCESVIDWGRFT